MSWDELFFNIIKEYKNKSQDPSSKFAALIISPDHSIRASGFNGFPRGVNDLEERYNDRKMKYLFVVHAEENAICSAAKSGISINGCTIYIDNLPCSSCCKSIIQSGIKEIVINGDSEVFNNKEFAERWKEDYYITRTMCVEADVKIRIYKSGVN